MPEVGSNIPEAGGALAFNTGIVQVTTQSDLAPASLPDAAGLVPGETGYTEQLTKLLFPPSVEQSLLDSLRPEIDNRQMLNPVVYQATLENSFQEISQLGEEHAGTPKGDKLKRAADELQSELEMTNILSMCRHLLHQA